MTTYTLFSQGAAGTLDSYTGAQTNGLLFSVSAACTFTGIWFYSASGATGLPTETGLYDNDTTTLIFSDSSPSWSGAAGSGWIKYTPASPPSLAAGVNYMAVAGNYSGTAEWYAVTGSYWSTGITSGILSCPDDPDYWDDSGSFTLPAQAFGVNNIWLDVQVTTQAAGPAVAYSMRMFP